MDMWDYLEDVRDWLLDNEQYTTEDMELIIEAMSGYNLLKEKEDVS